MSKPLMTSGLTTNELTAVRECLHARQREMLTLVRLLVETETPSGDEEGSRAAIELLCEAARETTCIDRLERIASSGCGEHLRIHFFTDAGSQAGTTLLLGHTDTVYPRGTLARQPFHSEGDRLYGPGVFDMKANCVLALEAARALATLGISPARPAVLLLTCDEETGSATSRLLIEEEAARAARVLVLEPSAPGGRVKTGRKGTGTWSIRAHGRAAHAGLDPEAGASAVREIARQIESLYSMEDAARGTTVNVGGIGGGTRSNVVAAEACAELDVRFGSLEEARRVQSLLGDLKPFDPRVRLTIDGGINRPPLERTAQVVRLYREARDIAARLGFELGEQSVGGASDGNLAAAFCPAVLDGLGIEGDGAHAAHEHIIVTDMPRRGALLAGLIAAA